MGKQRKRWLFKPEIIDPKGEKTIFIGGIPLDIKVKSIKKKILDTVPESCIKHLEIISKTKKKKSNRIIDINEEFCMGFAFLILKKPEDLQAVLSRPIMIREKRLDMKKAIIGDNDKLSPSIFETRAVILDIREDLGMNESTLKKFLDSQRLNYARAYLPYDYKEKRYKGVAVIDFKTKKDASDFLEKRKIKYAPMVWFRVKNYQDYQREEQKIINYSTHESNKKIIDNKISMSIKIENNHNKTNLRINPIEDKELLEFLEEKREDIYQAFLNYCNGLYLINSTTKVINGVHFRK